MAQLPSRDRRCRSRLRADGPDGGIKDVQIWLTEQRWVDSGDGTETSLGPTLAGAPSASAPSSATAGQPADQRAGELHTHTAGDRDRRQYVIWATALNFYGGSTETQRLRIDVP